jgi:hypothetical protein
MPGTSNVFKVNAASESIWAELITWALEKKGEVSSNNIKKGK